MESVTRAATGAQDVARLLVLVAQDERAWGAHQLEDPFILESTAAQQTFGLRPKPWNDMLADVVAGCR